MEFIQHIAAVALLIIAFYFLLTWRRKIPQTNSASCEADYNVLKQSIKNCKTEFGVLRIGEDIQAFVARYRGKVNQDRITTYWHSLNRDLVLRFDEIQGNAAYG
jgi:hypothetical protein